MKVQGSYISKVQGSYISKVKHYYVILLRHTGLPRFPKWGHLRKLHKAIKLCENALMNNEPVTLGLGLLQEVIISLKHILTLNHLFLIYIHTYSYGKYHHCLPLLFQVQFSSYFSLY